MLTRGMQISGFSLVRRLGAGGMGEIWEVVRRRGDFEQRAALKIANPDILAMAEGRALFEREASLSASLRHPNIASVLSADLSKGHIFYELVDGADLRTVLNEGAGNQLPIPLLVSVLYQICRGLSHAHQRQVQGKLSPVIHRDMSPGNVVLDYDGNVKIVDFGIAKAIAQGERSEIVKGKLNYMAPEQATAGEVDSRTDQYAVGIIAYEAIAGQRPFDGAHEGETLHNILQGLHVPIQEAAPHVPAGLAITIERMLSVKPEDRFPDMDAVIDALEPFTPPLGVHRELAARVQAARPRHTILFKDGQFVSVPISAPPPRPMRARRESLHAPPPAGARPRASTPQAMALDAPAPSVAPGQRSGRSPLLLAAVGALLAALAVGGGLVALSPDREESAAVESDARPGDAAPDTPVPTPVAAAADAPGRADEQGEETKVEAEVEAEPQPDSPAPAINAGATPAQTVAVEAVQTPPKETPSDKPEKARSERRAESRAKGTLNVGVFPPTNVWVDGRRRGRSPLSLELRPGRHTVGAGEREPVVTRRVVVNHGETTKIFLELGNQPSASTDSPAP